MRGKRGTGRNSPHRYERSDDASPQARQARAFLHKDPPVFMPVIGSRACWCGNNGHDWPGKAGGAPHPRDWPGKAEGQPYPVPQEQPC